MFSICWFKIDFPRGLGKHSTILGLKFLVSQWWCYGYVVKIPSLNRIDSHIAKLVDDLGLQSRFQKTYFIPRSEHPPWEWVNHFKSLSLPFHIFKLRVIRRALLEKAMAPHSSTLAWKIPWMKEPGRLQSMGSRRVGATSLSLFTFLHWRRNGNPLQCSCLENPRDGGAGEPCGLPSMASYRVRHDWSNLAAAAPPAADVPCVSLNIIIGIKWGHSCKKIIHNKSQTKENFQTNLSLAT